MADARAPPGRTQREGGGGSDALERQYPAPLHEAIARAIRGTNPRRTTCPVRAAGHGPALEGRGGGRAVVHASRHGGDVGEALRTYRSQSRSAVGGKWGRRR